MELAWATLLVVVIVMHDYILRYVIKTLDLGTFWLW